MHQVRLPDESGTLRASQLEIRSDHVQLRLLRRRRKLPNGHQRPLLKRGWTMQYAIPFVATAALIVGVAIPFAVAAALFASALTVARAQQNPPA